jgi:hypothetical protein
MALPRSRRVAAIAAAAAFVLALTACGNNGTPAANGTSEPTGQGQIGDASATATTTPDATATTTSSGGGGGGGGSTQGPTYPSNAKDYGLAVLKAIDDNNTTRVVDLADLNTAQYNLVTHQYYNLNGTWTNVVCDDSGSSTTCRYFNQKGNLAHVVIDKTKLGQAHAVGAVSIESSNLPTDAGSYLSGFLSAWRDGNTLGMRAHASQSVVTYAKSKQTPSAVGQASNTVWDCGSGKKCVDISTDFVAGQLYGTIYHFVVDLSKISSGTAEAIVGWVPENNTPH